MGCESLSAVERQCESILCRNQWQPNLCRLREAPHDKGTAIRLIKPGVWKQRAQLSSLYPAGLCSLLNGAGHTSNTPKKSSSLSPRGAGKCGDSSSSVLNHFYRSSAEKRTQGNNKEVSFGCLCLWSPQPGKGVGVHRESGVARETFRRFYTVHYTALGRTLATKVSSPSWKLHITGVYKPEWQW